MRATERGDKKYYRVLNILNRLNAGPVRVAELCAEFGICERSVQRDLERINLTGFHLDTPAKGTYAFAPGVSLKNYNLTGEQLSVLVLLRGLAAGMGGAVADAFDQVFARATRATPSESLFHSVGARALNPLTRRFYEDIAFAIERRKKLEITYESAAGERKVRVIRPVKILSSESFFYLLAMPDGSWAKGDFIKYRVDRLRALKVLPEEFPPLPPGRVSRAIGEATTIWGVNDGKPEKVVLRAEGAAADFVRSKEILPRQKVSKPGPGGAVTVTGVIRHRMEAIPLVLHWLPEITVLEPEGLKRDVRQRIEAYLKK